MGHFLTESMVAFLAGSGAMALSLALLGDRWPKTAFAVGCAGAVVAALLM